MAWQYGRGGGNGHQEEHHDLFRVMREGNMPNEGEYGAMSTMTSILGRMAAYSGKELDWKAALESKVEVFPQAFYNNPAGGWDIEPLVKPGPDGFYPRAVPGKTKVI